MSSGVLGGGSDGVRADSVSLYGISGVIGGVVVGVRCAVTALRGMSGDGVLGS